MSKKYLWPSLIAVLAILFYVPFLGSVHLFDWDEINFAESAREMLVTQNYLTVQIDFQPFWEKPPLFIWLQVLSMKVFGVNEFAARFPNALCGITTLVFLFFVGKNIYNRQVGLWWALVFGASVLPFVYFKSGIIDPWFNLFIFGGIYFIFSYLNAGKKTVKYAVLAATSVGLAVLTKGPVGFLLFGLTIFIYLLFKRFNFNFRWKDVIAFFLVFAFVGGFWFILQLLSGNIQLIKDFITYQVRLFSTQDAGHGGFFAYHFVVLFFGVFPASVFALKSFKLRWIKAPLTINSWPFLMKILLWVVLILFTMVKTKIVHYSSLAYFPITFLAAWVIYQAINQNKKFNRWLIVLIAFIGGVYSLLIAAFPYIDRYKQQIIESGIINDDFAVANLQAKANWAGWEPAIGFSLILITSVFAWLASKKKNKKAVITLFGGTALFLFFTISWVVPRIEKYSQNAAITFFKGMQDKEAYVETYGYKSYAQLFYTHKKPPVNSNSYNKNWLLKSATDKPVYFIMKITKADHFFTHYPNFEKVYEKNGFVVAKKSSSN